MRRLFVPQFQTEADEMFWWDAHLDTVEENLVDGILNGTARRGTATRILADARKALSGVFRHVTIRILEDDLLLAREQAREKGFTYQNYIASVLHEALARRRRR
jgi:hypothetical protein